MIVPLWILLSLHVFYSVNGKVASLVNDELKKAIESKNSVFVKFYAPWCGHCKTVAPKWTELSKKYKASTTTSIVEVDCTENQEVCKEYGVQGYPTIKLFKKGDHKGIQYKGARDVPGFTKFLNAQLEENIGTEGSPFGLSPFLILTITFIIGLMVGIYLFCCLPRVKKTNPKFHSIIDTDNVSKKKGDGDIHRSILTGGFTKPIADTLYHNFQLGVKNYAKSPCFGYRPVLNEIAEAYQWETYEEVNQRIQNLGAALMHYRMIPAVDGMRMMAIYMKNCPEWEISAQALFSCGGVTIPLYDTLGESSTEYIINQTELQTVVCTAAELVKLIHVKPKCKSLLHVVLVGDIKESLLEDANKAGIKVRKIKDLEAIGEANPRTATPSKPSDVASFMYTSGTTGNPKGAMLTHAAMLCNAEAVVQHAIMCGVQPFTNDTVHLSYLPLAHAFERTIHLCTYPRGGCIGFYQGNRLKLVEDLTVLRPTLFCSVPRLLNKIHDKIVNGAKAGSKVKAWLFQTALNTKMNNLKQGYTDHPFWDKLVFSKIRKKLGLDRCQFMATGVAPIAPDVLAFLRVAFLCPVAEGYGQTEVGCGSNLTHLNDLSTGTVGGPLPCCEIKLVSVPEMGYEVTDTIHGEQELPCNGRGEICFRGPSLFNGYYKMKDKTDEAIDSEGWLHSGDIGLWTLDGKLKIIDRKKNIFKLSQGEYVAPEKIENIILGSPYVAQAFVYGDSFHSHLVGIIVPDEEQLKILANELNLSGDIAQLCDNEQVVKAVKEDIIAVGKGAKLSGFETVREIFITPEPFSVENNILTPTFKLRRNDAKKTFLTQIDKLYLKSQDAIAGKQLRQE